MLPSFSNSSVRDLCSIFLEVAYELRDKILQLSNQSDTVDMYHWWGRGTLDVIGKVRSVCVRARSRGLTLSFARRLASTTASTRPRMTRTSSLRVGTLCLPFSARTGSSFH